MHVRAQNYGESCRSLRRISSQHMRPVLPLATSKNTVAVTGDRHCSLPFPVSTATATDSFFKDGRQISIGDCALFKPPQDCPPFIGLIRSLRLSKENNLQLGVNWLYRPAELELGKGTPVDSAPNEIFYSFHKDETPAATLLHPCKVAFLPRGAEFSKGTSSYVCRRVYDVENKCLWWLTDQNFINERQEEVDQLLYKTRTEMHAMLQPDGRSPKQVNNSPKSSSQLKPASDSGQSSGNFPSQVKGKKRERVEHSSDYMKRGRSSRTDGVHHKSESNLKSEIARITENGGELVELEGVDKLVQLMQPDRMERKMELASRSMLAGVMAATDNVDCLIRFVQLRGLPILDEWLQDIHKEKVGDGNNDKFVEELLLVLLCALDKLPVNLHALQMCNIGRSVNHLRSHKNLEIQRKARSLVDKWKKRVVAEMISIDSKSRQPETSQKAQSDVPVKSSITENSAIKTTSVNGENNNMKSATSSFPGAGKPASSNRISIGDVVPPLIREDRCSSSNSQSHNQSRSSSGKEDGGKSSTAAVSVAISNNARSNRSSGSFPVSNTGNQKETTSSVRIFSAHKTTTALEKFYQSQSMAEGSGHKLIVKIPNRVQSPAQVVVGGSLEDPTANMSSRASSPPLTDKQFDHTSQDKSDGHRDVATDVNVGSSQNSASKNATDEEHRMIEDPWKSVDASPSKQWNPEKLHASSFSPMNALVESCAKYSEAANSLEDDVGMNLLASVAAGEIYLSTMMISPADSTEKSTLAVCNGNEAKSKSSPVDNNMVRVQSEFCNGAECDKIKQAAVDGLNISKHVPIGISGDKVCNPHNTSEDIRGRELMETNEKSNYDDKSDEFCKSTEEQTGTDLLNDKDKLTAEVEASHQSSDGNFQNESKEELNMGTSSPQKLTSVVAKDEVAELANYEKLHPTACVQVEVGGGVNAGEPNEKDLKGCTNKFDGVNTVMKLNRSDSHCKEDCSSTCDEIKNYHKEENVKDEEIHDISVHGKGSVSIEADEKAKLKGSGSTCNPDEASSSAAEASDLDSKVKFDLNEGFSVDEDKYGDSLNLLPSFTTTVHSIPSSNHSASITVAAPAKGPFVPPEDLLRSKVEIGWKGSADTSAFRPAEPRKTSPDASISKHGRVPLDIDLNVPDERILEEMAYHESTNDIMTSCATSLNGAPSSVPVHSSGWLDFDLNTVDEANDVGQCSTSSNHKVDLRRDFDLNNWPGVDDNSTEQFRIIQQMNSPGIPLPPHLSSASLRMNSPGLRNSSSWFLPGSTYSTVAIPSVLPADRGEQQRFPVFPSSGPQRPFVGPPSGVNTYIPDVYRGSVLSSSPMPLQPSPFQFPVFQFGDTIPVRATSSYADSVTGPRLFAPPMNPQFQGPVASQFQRPFMVNLLPENRSNDGLGNGRIWGRQGLDLNSGPGTMESEVREQMLAHSSFGQHSIAGSQVLAEEHARLYSVSCGTLKRNDHPEGTRENESFRRKRSPWQ